MKIDIVNKCLGCDNSLTLTTSLNDIEILSNNYQLKELSMGKELNFSCQSCGKSGYFLVNDIGTSIQVILNGNLSPAPFYLVTDSGHKCNIDYTGSTLSYQSLAVSLRDIEDLLLTITNYDRPEKTILRLSFVQVITILEVYLSEVISETVQEFHQKYLINLLKSDKNTKDIKIDLQDLALNPDILQITIRDYLHSIVYHNLSRVNRLFKGIFEVELPFQNKDEQKFLFRSVKTRHDCVHRNGQDLLKESAGINKEAVSDLIESVLIFTSDIEKILATRENKPEKEYVNEMYYDAEDYIPF